MEHIDDECPSYHGTDVVPDEYIAIGTFGIIAVESLSLYQGTITAIMTSESFIEECIANMNGKLNNETNNKRRLLSYDRFSIVSIDIIDPLNDTTTSGNGESTTFVESNTGIVTIVLCCAVSLICIILGIYFGIYRKRNIGEPGYEGNVNVNKVELMHINNDHQNGKNGIISHYSHDNDNGPFPTDDEGQQPDHDGNEDNEELYDNNNAIQSSKGTDYI